MKTIGLIGGMSWESTKLYYQLINEYISTKLGKHHSAEMILYSVDFERILTLTSHENWVSVAKALEEIAKKLERSGVDFLLLASNAAHKVFSQIEKKLKIPLLHIADPTGNALQKANVTKALLLGTQITMKEPFYRERLSQFYGIEAHPPDEEKQKILHQIIFEELTLGKTYESSRKSVQNLIQEAKKRGFQAVILACTELTLLLSQKEAALPLFDTMALHAQRAAELALSAQPISE